MNETIQKNLEILSNDNGVFYDFINGSGDGVNVTSYGIGADYIKSDTRGNSSSPNVWTDDSGNVSDNVSSGDIDADTPTDTQELMAIQEAVAESNTQVIESLSAIHSVLILIFAFLLFEWTEKKLKVTVNRFTDKRRK